MSKIEKLGVLVLVQQVLHVLHSDGESCLLPSVSTLLMIEPHNALIDLCNVACVVFKERR